MLESAITKLIVSVAHEQGIAPDAIDVREATSCGATKAGMARMVRNLAGKTVFLYSLSQDADLREWLTGSGWQHRNIDCADLFWRAL